MYLPKSSLVFIVIYPHPHPHSRLVELDHHFFRIRAHPHPPLFHPPEYRSATSFRIMLAIGVCDCYQLIVMGICPYFKYIQFYAAPIENVMGALNESTLDILFILNLLLAINRLCVVVKINVLHNFSTKDSGSEKFLYKFLYILTAIIFLLITLLFLSPFCGLYLDQEYTIWNYNLNLTWTFNVRAVEVKGYMSLPIICFGIYCVIVVLLVCNSSKSLINGSNSSVKGRELRIFLQSLLQFLAFIFPAVYGVAGWGAKRSALDNYGITSVCTILYCGLNPILYLFLLPVLRRQVLSVFGIGKASSTVTVLISVGKGNTNVQPMAKSKTQTRHAVA